MALTEFLTTDRALASVFNTKVVTPANVEFTKLKTFQDAGGTGTAITLTGVELTDGFNLTFIATASNSAAATTINGKNLYKPNTVLPPNIISGKAITVWYDLGADCFFLKASAEGNAVVGDVLAGKTFSNDDDTGLIGTLALTGDALVSDVAIGKTFYNTDAKTKLTGLYSNIKSIQEGLSSPFNNTTVTTFDISISTIDQSKSVIIIEPGMSGGQASSALISATFIDDNTIRLKRSSSPTSNSVPLKWSVIEFNSVKSKQSGSVFGNQASTTIPVDVQISPITIAKSIIFTTKTTTIGTFSTVSFARCVSFLTNNETLSIYTDPSNTVEWQVIEFN